jgi:hypothetical protein
MSRRDWAAPGNRFPSLPGFIAGLLVVVPLRERGQRNSRLSRRQGNPVR